MKIINSNNMEFDEKAAEVIDIDLHGTAVMSCAG